ATHRLLAAGMEYRAKNNVIRSGKQTIGADRVPQVHRIASRNVRGRPLQPAAAAAEGTPCRPVLYPHEYRGKPLGCATRRASSDHKNNGPGAGGPVRHRQNGMLSRAK